jgi:transposase
VARDRSKEFAAAITEALPHAKHVADRWHLAKNLTEYLDKVEGHINRLKLIKRQAYGRASLSYLQHRFLPAA